MTLRRAFLAWVWMRSFSCSGSGGRSKSDFVFLVLPCVVSFLFLHLVCKDYRGQGGEAPKTSARQDSRALCLPRTKVREKAFIPEASWPEGRKLCVPLPFRQGRKERQGRRFPPHRFCQLPQGPLSPAQNRPPDGPTGAFSGPGRGGDSTGRSRGGQRPHRGAAGLFPVPGVSASPPSPSSPGGV